MNLDVFKHTLASSWSSYTCSEGRTVHTFKKSTEYLEMADPFLYIKWLCLPIIMDYIFKSHKFKPWKDLQLL